MKADRVLTRLGLIGVVAVGVAVIAINSWASNPTCGNTPQQMFEGVLLRPVPGGVRDLQGVGDMWQSYSVWLRFRGTDEAIQQIVTDGFVRTSRADAAPHFHLPNGYDLFDPVWAPPVERCEYYRAARRCPWSEGGGRQWLLIDRESGVVYACAEGS